MRASAHPLASYHRSSLSHVQHVPSTRFPCCDVGFCTASYLATLPPEITPSSKLLSRMGHGVFLSAVATYSRIFHTRAAATSGSITSPAWQLSSPYVCKLKLHCSLSSSRTRAFKKDKRQLLQTIKKEGKGGLQRLKRKKGGHETRRKEGGTTASFKKKKRMKH